MEDFLRRHRFRKVLAEQSIAFAIA